MGIGAGAIPSIAAGAGSILGGIFGRPKLSDPSRQEQTALQGGLGTTANLGRQGGQLFGLGGQQLAGANQFINPLLFGDRSAISATLAPQRQTISDQLSGVLRSLEGRGGQGRVSRDQARTQAFGQQALFPILARSQAAGTAAGIGQNLLGMGTGATEGAAGLFGGLQNQLAGQRLAGDELLFSQPSQGDVIGSGIFEILKGTLGNRGGGNLPSSPLGGNIGLIPGPPRNIGSGALIPGTGALPTNIAGWQRSSRLFPVGA